MSCEEPKEHKHFRPGTRLGGSVTRGTEELFMCQTLLCPFWPLLTFHNLDLKKLRCEQRSNNVEQKSQNAHCNLQAQVSAEGLKISDIKKPILVLLFLPLARASRLLHDASDSVSTSSSSHLWRLFSLPHIILVSQLAHGSGLLGSGPFPKN